MRKSWTLEKIKKGFDRFLAENGRLPRALEVDKLEYLPTSRFIQSKFGGLEKLRKQLGYSDIHFGKGRFRSLIASRVGKRGRIEELALEQILRNKFGEVFVHTEKIFDKTKNRVDFYVYSKDGNFGIDIFYPESIKTLCSNLNIKMKKYGNFPTQLYLVVANRVFSQIELDKVVSSKKIPIPEEVRLIALDNFLEFIDGLESFPNPIHEKFHGGQDLGKS